MEFGSYASQQPCRTMYKPFSLLRNSSRSASALYAHINIYIISILTNENSLSSHRLLFLLQFLTILKFLSFFFFFLVKFQLQRKKRKTKTNTIDGKNSKSKFLRGGIHFRVYPARYHPLTMFICDRQQAVQARGNARPLFPDCKPRFRVTWVTCLPRAHRPPGWANQPIRRFNCFICQFCPRTSLKLGSARQ